MIPNTTGSYYKATTFVIENNLSPLEYIINIVIFVKKTISELKRPHYGKVWILL
jgi:hypothetical protein